MPLQYESPIVTMMYATAAELHENRQRAAAELAKLLSREFSTIVTAKRVLSLFDTKWKTMSDLAHAIHEGRPR